MKVFTRIKIEATVIIIRANVWKTSRLESWSNLFPKQVHMYFFNIKYDEFICSEVWAAATSCKYMYAVITMNNTKSIQSSSKFPTKHLVLHWKLPRLLIGFYYLNIHDILHIIHIQWTIYYYKFIHIFQHVTYAEYLLNIKLFILPLQQSKLMNVL